MIEESSTCARGGAKQRGHALLSSDWSKASHWHCPASDTIAVISRTDTPSHLCHSLNHLCDIIRPSFYITRVRLIRSPVIIGGYKTTKTIKCER